MENLLNLDRVNNFNSLIKNIEIDKTIDKDLYKNKENFGNIITNIIDKGGDYIIKALPVNESLKDVLIDVKGAFKTKDFKEIVKTALDSSIREGLELLKIPKNVISDITKIKDIAFKGGLRQALCAGIDIIIEKYTKNNLFANIIGDFVKQTKNFIFSNAFKLKLDSKINKVLDKTKDYGDLCKNWYEAYEKFDLDSINKLAEKINKKEKGIEFNKDNINENNIIQNITKLVNVKKEKLSPIQLQICNTL